MSLLDDENILMDNIRNNITPDLNLILRCKDYSPEDLLEIIKLIFYRNDLAKDLYWEESKVFGLYFFLKKDPNNDPNRTIIILTIKIKIDRIILWLHGHNMYHIFNIDNVHMLDTQKEFGDWIKELGFNKRPINYSHDNIKEYIFKP
jgi:hypothetical protein